MNNNIYTYTAFHSSNNSHLNMYNDTVTCSGGEGVCLLIMATANTLTVVESS